ncbi:nucleoside hydrolase [Nanoarchaeota archaeon]
MKKVILDSDIGDDICDALALIFALNSPELDIKAIISNNGHEKERAKIIHKIVSASGKNIPIFQGIKGGKGILTNQKAFIKNYKHAPKKLKDNLSYFKKLAKEEITYISLGTLTNIDYLLKRIPKMKKSKFYVMGGSINKDYHGKHKKIAEWNLHADPKPAQNVLKEKLKLTLVPLDATWDLVLSRKDNKIIKNNSSLVELYHLWKKSHKRLPIRYDSFTIALAIKPSLAKYKKYKISVDNKGHTLLDNKGNSIKTAIKGDKKRFHKLFMRRLNR